MLKLYRSRLPGGTPAGGRVALRITKMRLFTGNSIGTTTGSVIPYPTRIATRSRYIQDTFQNNCVTGESLATTIANFQARVGDYAESVTKKPLTVHLGCADGVGIAAGDSAATCFARIQSFVALCLALSPPPEQIIIGTVCPGTAFAGAPNVQRLALNALCLADTSGTFTVHLMSEQLPDNLAAAYQGDNQHLSNIGHQAIAFSYDQVIGGGLDLGPYAYFKQIQIGDGTGGFGDGGIHGTSFRLEELSGVLYLQLPSDTRGLSIFDYAKVGAKFSFSNNGALGLFLTITPAGTNGAQTIDKPAGCVNFAIAATSLVVTNALVTTNSVILCTVGTNDTTMKSALAVAASGSFTIFPNAAPTAATRVNFLVINAAVS